MGPTGGIRQRRRNTYFFDPGDTFKPYEEENAADVLNDLDIYLMPKFAGNINQAIASSISDFSNVEHIFFEIPSNGEYEFWILQNTVPTGTSQDYAVAWWYGEAPELPGPTLSGDFNNDGIVDGIDFLEWQRDPGIGDLADWETGFGSSTPLVANSVAVPEPGPFALLLLAACGLGLVRTPTRVRHQGFIIKSSSER